MKAPKNWSVSKIHCFEACPHQYEGKYLLGVRSKPGPAAARGLEIHAKAERYLDGTIRGLPNELEKLAPEYRALKKTKPMVELKLAVDTNWDPVSWSSAWARGILDVVARSGHEMIIVDHKTGRIYDHHVDQAQVYACLLSSSVPDATNYRVEMWYTDQGELRSWDYTHAKIAGIRKSWEKRVDRLFSARKFPKTPSAGACKWCPRSTKKGGDCDSWRKI